MSEPKTFKIRDKETGKVFTIREKSFDASNEETIKKPIDNIPDKKKPTLIEQAISGPGRDIAAGLLKGNIAFSKPSASLLEFAGIPEKFNITKQVIGDAETLLQNL